MTRDGRQNLLHAALLLFLGYLVYTWSTAGRSTGLEPGTAAPPFSLPAVSGGTLALDRLLAERPALLVFFATWCRSCHTVIDDLAAMKGAERLGRVTVVLVGSTRNDPAGTLEQWGRQAPFPVLLDNGATSAAYHVSVLPTVVLVGRDGRIEWAGLGLPEPGRLDG